MEIQKEAGENGVEAFQWAKKWRKFQELQKIYVLFVPKIKGEYTHLSLRNICVGLISLILGLAHLGQAQDTTKLIKRVPFSITLSHHEGFFYKHRPSIYGLPDANAEGFEVNFKRITFGSRHWEQLYKYPQYGITFIYMNNGIPLLGRSYMLLPYYSIPIFRKNNHSLFFDIGLGVSYVTTTFSQDTLNTLISSHVNFSGMARINYNYTLTKNLKLDISANFIHNSNAGTNRPNLGINTPSLSVGLQYIFNPDLIKFRKDSIPRAIKRPVFSASYGLGYKAVEYDSRPYNTYYCHTVSLTWGYQLSRRSIPTIGIDWLYDLSLEARAGQLEQTISKRESFYAKDQLLRDSRIGILLGHELLVTKRFTMIGQFGVFVYNPFQVDANSNGFGNYQRLGLRYLFTKNLFVAWYLKTFYARADNYELTVGFRL